MAEMKKNYGGLEEEVNELKVKCGDQEANRKEWKAKYVGLKRKVTSLVEEVAETLAKKVAKR